MFIRNKIAIGVAAAAVVAGGIGVASIAGATAQAGPNICRATKDDSLHARSTCQKGEVPFALAKGAKGDTGPQGPAGPAGKDGSNAIKIVHKSVAVTADFPDASAPVAERTITIDGLPAYTGAGTAATPTLEVWGSNAGDSSTLAGTSLSVIPLPTTVGSHTRKFLVNATGFNGTKSFALDIWVLAVVG